METQDLFPEDFIVALPTPSNYVGPNRIFAENGEFHSQLRYITDAGREEEDGYPFYFKHKKAINEYPTQTEFNRVTIIGLCRLSFHFHFLNVSVKPGHI